MTGLLQDVAQFAGTAWLSFAVVFLRVGAAMALLPGFGERAVPPRVRLAVAIAFTLIVTPAVAPHGQDIPFLRALGTETVAGLLIGISLRLLIHALEMAGTIAAQSTSLAQLFPGAVEPMPVISHLLVWGALSLAMMAGLHIRVCELFVASYDVLPMGHLPAAVVVKDWGLGQITASFSLAIRIAAPFFAISFLYNVALGIINRAMPQLMVAFVGAPAISMGAILLLALCAPVALSIWVDVLGTRIADPFGAAP